VIRVRGLRVEYDPRVRALDGVSLDIAAGEFVALIGPSGAGKSTFLRCLNGFVTPTAGDVTVDGQRVTGAPPAALRRTRARIGFVFQQFNLLARTTALENVELPLVYAGIPFAAQRERARAALGAVALAGREAHLPSQLSGGQQQRVAIARALVNDPSLVLADEPTGNLDTETSIEIMELFARLHREQGVTIVVVTHEPDIAAYAERRITFRDGQIVSDVRAGRAPRAGAAKGLER
jgi:putative ABC transport system ATP-binding protein